MRMRYTGTYRAPESLRSEPEPPRRERTRMHQAATADRDFNELSPYTGNLVAYIVLACLLLPFGHKIPNHRFGAHMCTNTLDICIPDLFVAASDNKTQLVAAYFAAQPLSALRP
ncbi:hypothetical protein DFH06DRAFT_1150912 [Mycena polygramma]|nr:hypothetical protein DFH06DRAFT_1150912 [Mycena polygramma]